MREEAKCPVSGESAGGEERIVSFWVGLQRLCVLLRRMHLVRNGEVVYAYGDVLRNILDVLG